MTGAATRGHSLRRSLVAGAATIGEKLPMLRDCPKCGVLMVRYHSMRDGLANVRYYCRPCTSKRIAASGKKTSYNAKWNQKYPEKRYAHKAVEYAIKRGDLARKSCEVCGDERSHAHHDDYSKPLEVMWLCQPHHRDRHKFLEASRGLSACALGSFVESTSLVTCARGFGSARLSRAL